MTYFAQPSWMKFNRFEMRVLPNERIFQSPYSGTVQALDLLGERWTISGDIVPTIDPNEAAQREAFFDRLRGQVNGVTMGHQKLTGPLGTFGSGAVAATWKNASAATMNWVNASSQPMVWQMGTPIIAADIAQLANTGTIRTLPGRTLLAGSLIGLAGQLVRISTDTVADASGNMPIEFYPRARQLIPAYTVVVFSAPTANFILKPGTLNVPTSWTPGVVDGATIELIEVF